MLWQDDAWEEGAWENQVENTALETVLVALDIHAGWENSLH
jgi:hypothetical protein